MEQHILEAQRYFSNYRLPLERSEIGLREYDLAAKALEADNRSLTAASGIALFVGGAFATIIGSRDLSTLKAQAAQSGFGGFCVLSGSLMIVALLLTHYFACLQRSAVHAARKIVVLRRLLGLDYGNIETVLPSETLDGANEPFAIAMFPGWTSLQAIPTMTVALVTGLAEFLIFVGFEAGGVVALKVYGKPSLYVGPIVFFVIMTAYRLALLENFETIGLLLARWVGQIIKVPLKKRTGHVLYRLRLAIAEAHRLQLNLRQMHDLLVYIEDRRFFLHNGNSATAALGAVYRYIRYGKRSGGSTILQQLARSNFLQRLDAPLRRKIMEWLVAPWLNRTLTKQEALDAYLVSVRFAAGAIGLPDGIRHFFPDHKLSEPLPAHRKFILIERLSNVTATFPRVRIRKLVNSCLERGFINKHDVKLINIEYMKLGDVGKINLSGQIPSLDSED